MSEEKKENRPGFMDIKNRVAKIQELDRQFMETREELTCEVRSILTEAGFENVDITRPLVTSERQYLYIKIKL